MKILIQTHLGDFNTIFNYLKENSEDLDYKDVFSFLEYNKEELWILLDLNTSSMFFKNLFRFLIENNSVISKG